MIMNKHEFIDGGGGVDDDEEREHMFDKVVTPSDVGKLNRLVIPKQHAEKYLPLNSSTNDVSKGLLLSFQEYRNGKSWRFRYSYWNSSQSYVMTKGWSKFVREKKLDAGDIVSFQRGIGSELAKNRLFIDWRRGSHAPDLLPHHHFSNSNFNMNMIRSITHPWNQPLFLQPRSRDYSHEVMLHNHQSDQYHHHHHHRPSNGYPLPNYAYSSTTHDQAVIESRSVPQAGTAAAAKRLRLFGVNMDCPIQREPTEHDQYSPTNSSSSFSSLSDSNHLSTRPNYNHSAEEKRKGTLVMSLDLEI